VCKIFRHLKREVRVAQSAKPHHQAQISAKCRATAALRVVKDADSASRLLVPLQEADNTPRWASTPAGIVFVAAPP
jgi:hypothetical protein